MITIAYGMTLAFFTQLQDALKASSLVTVTGCREIQLKKRLTRNGYNLRVATDYQRGAVIVQRRRE